MRLFSLLILSTSFLLGGCGLFGGKDKTPLPGERVSVLQLDKQLEVSEELADVEVRLPPPDPILEWPQSGGNAQHNLQHVALAERSLQVAWSSDIGTGSSSSQRILAEPIIFEGVLYAIDAEGDVSAISTSDGQLLWRTRPSDNDEDDDLFGGGLAAGEGKVFVTTPYARMVALDAKTGAEIWSATAPSPYRAAPTFSDGRVFAITIDNQLTVFAADNGKSLWTNTGIETNAGLLGGAAPAVSGVNVVSAYTSGELIAFDVVGGRTLWGDSLAGTARGSQVNSFTDIHGRPVIDGNIVFAIGNGGVAAAIDLNRGGRLWDASVGGTQSPWVAGDFIFLLTNNAELVCLSKESGKIKWVQGLPRFVDPEDPEELIYWAGPVLAGDRLLVTGSTGLALSFSPYNGQPLGKLVLPGPTHVPPVIAGDTLYILTDNAEIVALH